MAADPLPVLTATSARGCVDVLRREAKFKRDVQAPAARRRSDQYREAGDHAAALHRHQLADLRELEAQDLENVADALDEALTRQHARRLAIRDQLEEADR